MIERLTDFQADVLAFVCAGHVSESEYDAVFIPAVADALAKHDKVRLYYEIAPDFTGLEPTAVWENLKTGLQHIGHWERVAVVTDVELIARTVQFSSLLMQGTMKSFPVSEATQARAWIIAAS
jgi:hypothetical protein